MRNRRVGLASAAVAVAAFLLYHSTLLPGLDFGDTASFQATVGSPVITPRDGYPLYFAIGGAFLWATGAEPAHALNLASAVEGSLAVAVFVLVAVELTGSLMAAVGGGFLFAASYTFWSQAIIAEVYALHALFVGVTMWLLLRWSAARSGGRTLRIALFFLVYTLGFGNHLSMILLAPAYALFLLSDATGGPRDVMRPRIIGLAVACAVAGALPYWWNLRELWMRPYLPHGVIDAARMFWFDVTKTDWRATMVARVPESMLLERVRMYVFDLRQQFGWPIVILAVAGLVRVWHSERQRGWLLLLLYAVNVTFAFGYNVGDAHVFYLPSHLIVALMATAGSAAAGSWLARIGWPRWRVIAPAVLTAYACIRAYRDYPALDRSADRRPLTVLNALTSGLDGQHSILLTDLTWQAQNGLSYYTKIVRPDVVDARLPDVLLHVPALVRDNAAIGREVVLTEQARSSVIAAYGPLYAIANDQRVPIPAPTGEIAALAPGTRYVMCVLKPGHEFSLDSDALRKTMAVLGAPAHGEPLDYEAIAGVTGQPPALVFRSASPFSRVISLDGVAIEIRMESYLAFDTIRRMGFGQVVANRRHALIVERGLSFVAMDGSGTPTTTIYASNIYAPLRRYQLQIITKPGA